MQTPETDDSRDVKLTSVHKPVHYSMDISKYNTTVLIVALSKYSGLSPRLCEFLFSYFSELEELFKADFHTLKKIDGLDETAAKKISTASQHLDEAARFVDDLTKRNIRLISRFDPTYPSLLFELNDPPTLLFLRGEMPAFDRKTVALIGTSEASNAGIEMTSRLAKTFSQEGVQVVSSLYGGIDYAAHLGCKSAEGTSFAVIDGGFDSLAADDSMPLAIDIVKTGGIISEYPPDTKPTPDSYLQANRLLVGLVQAVVVTELYRESFRTMDLLNFCSMIGKLVFFMVDPATGAFADEESLSRAIDFGALPMVGYDKVTDIIKALV
ncbi:MAG: DNA-processing protein DprA [Candidatus Zixiibacteriota bacterium]